MRKRKAIGAVEAMNRVTPRLFLWLVAMLCGVLGMPALGLDSPNGLSPGTIVFYTLALAGMAFFSIAMLVTKQYTWLTYSVYGLNMTVLMAALDGTLSYLFGGERWMMTDAPLLIGAVAASFGFFHVAYRLERGHWASSTRMLQAGFGVLTASLIPLYLLVPTLLPNLVPLYAVLNTCMLLMFIAQILPPLTWTQLSKLQHRAAMIWPAITGCFAVGIYLVHFSGSGFERGTLDLINRAIFGLHMSHLLVFVCIFIIEGTRARLNAERNAAEAARVAAETELALQSSEREFERAKAIAADRSKQLASASHDIKQPIAALRQVIAQHSRAGEDSQTHRLHDAIDYLDQLAGSYLSMGEQALDEVGASDYEIDLDKDGKELVDLNLVLETVVALHTEDAKVRDITLHHRPTPISVRVTPLAMTRALSNLVGNALVHSECQRIVLFARIRDAKVRVEVHDDGKGMNSQQVELAKSIRSRGSDSSGSGLGLPIVQAQADEQGWEFILRSAPGRGTSAYLLVESLVAIKPGSG